MSVNTDFGSNVYAPETQGYKSPGRASGIDDDSEFSDGEKLELKEKPPIWDNITYTVEISDEARQMWANKPVTPEQMYEARKNEIGYSASDLAPLKARFSNLLEMDKNIQSRLGTLMGRDGITLSSDDQIKVEIDSGGRAVVGGIRDVKTARALEHAINNDKSLLEDITEFQHEERLLSDDMKATAGVSLREFSTRIDRLQRGAAVDDGLQNTTNPLSAYTPQEAIGLMDQDIYLVDSEFAGMISEHYGARSAKVTFTGERNILENAEETVNGTVRNVTIGIDKAFEKLNDQIRKGFFGPVNLEESLVYINRLKISVNNDGGLRVEGTASKNNAATDARAKEIIKDMFESELKDNSATGKQHDFRIAATYLLNTYDETFGEGNPLGLGADARTLETTFNQGLIESHVSSPERGTELAEKIDGAAKDALKDMNIDADDLTIAVNDNGKLTATNLNPEAPNARKIHMGLEVLNSNLESRTIGDAQGREEEFTTDPVKRLKALMANMDILRPGGASLLKRTEESLAAIEGTPA